MTLKFSLKVVENDAIIQQRIASALVSQVNKYLDNIYTNIKPKISEIIVNNLISQPEYQSLISGKLKGEFGIPDSNSRLSDILDTIKNGGMLTKKPTSVVNGKISAGIKLEMIKSDFVDLLSLGSASFTTEKGYQLDWLRWLLIEGDSVIISDYSFIEGPSQYSRTGLGVMRKNMSAFWRVPPEFAGNIKNNWITRGIESASSQIDSLLEQLAK